MYSTEIGETQEKAENFKAHKVTLLNRVLQPQTGASLGQPVAGQALVEFALILPILMLIIVGILEFGLAFFDAGKVDYSSREVARGVAICSNACDQNEQTTSGGSTNFQFDTADLAYVANSGYVNAPSPSPTLINPNMVQYIWIQRVYDNGYAIPVTGTVGGAITVTTGTDYRRNFNYFVYDTSWGQSGDSNAVPFIPAANGGRQPNTSGPGDLGNGGCTKDPWASGGIGASEYNNVSGIGTIPYSSNPSSSCIGWPSTTGVQKGRNVCEPTDRFFVEIGYKHYWITPLIPSNGGYIILKSRTYMKIEPQYFNNQNNGGVQASC